MTPVTAAPLLLLVAGLVIAATATWAVMRPLPQPAPQPVRFTVAPAGTLPLVLNSPYRDLALSPDGAHFVYGVGTSPTDLALWVRAVDQLVELAVVGGEFFGDGQHAL